jgi:hypothetical protein
MGRQQAGTTGHRACCRSCQRKRVHEAGCGSQRPSRSFHWPSPPRVVIIGSGFFFAARIHSALRLRRLFPSFR